MSNDELRKRFARRLQQARDAKGWKDSDLAKRLDRSKQVVHGWTSGKTFPGLATVSELAKLLDKPSHWFFQEGDLSGQEVFDLEELARKLAEAQQLANRILQHQTQFRPAKGQSQD